MTFTTRRIREEKPSRWKAAAKMMLPVLLKAGPLFVGLYESWKVRKEEEEHRTARIRILKKCLVILVSVLLGLILLAGTVKALVSLRILTVHNFLSVAGKDLEKDANGFTNILLLGAGDRDHDGIDLTDAIMVASIDPGKTKSAVMLSLPRDLYMLSTDKMGRGRVNELYRNYKGKLQRADTENASMESMKELSTEIGRKLGITIHYVAKVDFTAFVDIVNTMGGIDIDVPADLVDTEYPGPNYTYETFEIRKGPQHLDGETALKYARSRHSTSDFSRSARQQQILQAIGEKAKAQGIAQSPGQVSALLKILADHAETSMTFADILGAAKLGDTIDKQNILSMNLNIETGYDTPYTSPGGFLYTPPRDQFDGASVLLPVSIPQYPVTWKQIETFTRFVLTHRDILLQKPQIRILNAGAKTGAARLLGNELIRYGFEDIETDNASDDRRNPLKLASSFIAGRAETDNALSTFFSEILRIPGGALPPEIVPEKQGQITIVLGTDYSYAPLQDLLPTP